MIRRTKPRRRKTRRPKLPRDLDVRFTLPGIVREIDTPAGPRIDLAFFSLPLMKGGVR